MNKTIFVGFVLAALCLGLVECQKVPVGDRYAEVLAAFQDPPAEFRSAPLWVWNDRVTKEQVETQLADFRDHGIGGVFIHPRPGLITPYLSEEWLSLCRLAVDVGKKLGMKVWIYDENSYPSGFAGGHVPAEMPDAQGVGLRMTKVSVLPKSFENDPPLLVLSRTDSGFEDITRSLGQKARNGEPGDYYVFTIALQTASPWFGGFTYVDLMRQEVTAKFLDITLNAYKKTFGDEFGASVPGSFQDEAHIGPVLSADTINYTPGLFDRFQEKWGYNLRLHLPSIFEETGDWRSVRHDFYATTLDLFIDHWAKPYYDYCAANNLLLTGHYLEHEWPHPSYTPDFLAILAHAHVPGIDCLMNEWDSGPHAQFGNARPVKEIRSIASQLGRPRTLSETYGASGWDLTFFDQKRIADWEFALGVNLINQHLSYMTIVGARKRDHPLSFSYHEPWWHAYKIMGDYLGRLSVVMSKGEQDNHILVVEPTTTAWMYYSPAQPESLKALGDRFTDFINRLEAAQVEYDLGSEDVLKNHARVVGKSLAVGKKTYDLVVLPPGLENLEEPTVALISSYLDAGGRTISFSEGVRFVSAKESPQPAEIATSHSENWLIRATEEGIEELARHCSPDIHFSDLRGDTSTLFHHRRKLADAQIVFLANINPDRPLSGRFVSAGKSVEAWDAFSGQTSSYAFSRQGGQVEAQFSLPPGGSLLLCLKKKGYAGAPPEEPGWQEVRPEGKPEVKAESPNVLTLDYCDLRVGNRTEKDLYFYDAQRKTYEHHGLGRNPWDSAVQYKTNILDLDKFAPDSGFEATYWLDIDPGVDLSSLELVVERPHLYRVSVNGRETKPVPEKWWLDHAFGVFKIGDLSVAGKNRITLQASPFTIHTELEPVYILGHFGLESLDKGFKLVSTPEIDFGPWSEQGRPFYAAGVGYTKTYLLNSFNPEKERYAVRLAAWRGAVAEVKVGEKTAGFIGFEPFELDITGLLSAGSNRVSVIVYGTLKNTLGPHHNSPR
ncbi:MAG: glycosyl hydrolase, partial [Acidobacteriota bacterium]